MAPNTPVKVEPPVVAPATLWTEPFGFPLFRRMSREIDAMFNRFGLEPPSFATLPAGTWMPALEMFTKDNRLVVKLDVPGLSKEQVHVDVTDEHLVIRGERTHEVEEKKATAYHSERSYGAFVRTVPLPEGAKPDLATAVMHDGILEIAMPMPPTAAVTPRKLEITEPAPAPSSTKAA